MQNQNDLIPINKGYSLDIKCLPKFLCPQRWGFGKRTGWWGHYNYPLISSVLNVLLRCGACQKSQVTRSMTWKVYSCPLQHDMEGVISSLSLLRGCHGVSSCPPPGLSTMLFLPWSQPGTDWIQLKFSFKLCILVLYCSNGKVDWYK